MVIIIATVAYPLISAIELPIYVVQGAKGEEVRFHPIYVTSRLALLFPIKYIMPPDGLNVLLENVVFQQTKHVILALQHPNRII